MPMFFLSGALFPVAGLPRWLTFLNRIDPLTYAVDPMRRAVFAHLDISPAARQRARPGRDVVRLARARRSSRRAWSRCSALSCLGSRSGSSTAPSSAPGSHRVPVLH